MKKIFNLLMVMCLAVAALTLTFAVCLPTSKTVGANVSATSAMPSAFSFQTAEFDAVRPVGVNYFSTDGDYNRGLMLFPQPMIVSQSAVKQRNFVPPNYKTPVNRSLFDTPLFKNSKSLKQPPIFTQTPIRNSQLRR